MEFSSDGCSCLSFNKRVLWGCRLPPAKTRAAVPSEVWGRELSGRAADSARGLRLKLLKWKVHCSNPLVTGSTPVGGANYENPIIVPDRTPAGRETCLCPSQAFLRNSVMVTTFLEAELSHVGERDSWVRFRTFFRK